MKKVFKFVKGKKDEKKEVGGVARSQSSELASPARTPEDEPFSGTDVAAGYVMDFSGKDKTLTKLHKAAWQGSLEKLKSALKKVEIDAADRRNRTALHLAVVRGHPNIVWFLLGNNADANICDDEGRTPLLKAIECGHKECATLLLERGADVKVADYGGNTGLHVATGRGSPDAVSVLLKKGADPETPNNAGDYPLHVATKLESKELVDLLLNFDASVDALDREHRTPLMLAAKMGNVLLTQLFFDRGAQPTVVDSNGWTALDYAILSGHEKVAAKLKAFNKMEKKEAERKPRRQDVAEPNPAKSEEDDDDGGGGGGGGGGSETRNTPEASGRELVSQKLHAFYRKCSKEDEEDKTDDVSDSPSADSMPPYCQPPRSWEMIQAGMIDENINGMESKRRSITVLGTLRSRRESFAEISASSSPKYTLSLNRRKSSKANNSFAKQRFSFNEEDTSKLRNGENKSKSSDSGKHADSTPLAPESGWDGDPLSFAEAFQEDEPAAARSPCDDFPMPQATEEIRTGSCHLGPLPREKDYSRSFAVESFEGRDVFPPPPSALELGVDMAKSMKYMKGISEDHPPESPTGKNVWKKKTSGTRSMDYSEESEVDEERRGGLPRATAEIPKEITEKTARPWDRMFDVNKRISEELECYDQALRELAESRRVSTPHRYYSLPSCKTRDFEAENKTKSLSRTRDKRFLVSGPGVSLADVENCRSPESNVADRFNLSNNGKEGQSGFSSVGEPAKKLERQTKKQMLLAMRDVKHGVVVANAFTGSPEVQSSVPAEKPEAGSKKEEKGFDARFGDEGLCPDIPSLGVLPERRKSSSSGTGDEPTLWLQDKFQTKTRPDSQFRDSEEDVSEISEENETKHERSCSFSPLGVIYKEMEKEQRNAERTSFDFSDRDSVVSSEGGMEKWGHASEANCEEDEIVEEQSPDLSLSSGPVEPLGADGDSGSEPESSRNDVTPTRQFSFEARHEWLKSHLKTATFEKSKLEEVTAQLSEKTERLTYELADAKEAAKSRDEVIRLLQGQLARMEAAYTKSLEESVRSRLQLSSHEQEILHLKELCYKYEEEKPETNLEDLELRIRILEEEKKKMKEEICVLEEEKFSLEIRLKSMGEHEAGDQRRRWKERWKVSEKEQQDTHSGSSEEPLRTSLRSPMRFAKETKHRITDLEKQIAEVSKENKELKSKMKCLVREIQSEKSKKNGSEDFGGKLQTENLETKANADVSANANPNQTKDQREINAKTKEEEKPRSLKSRPNSREKIVRGGTGVEPSESPPTDDETTLSKLAGLEKNFGLEIVSSSPANKNGNPDDGTNRWKGASRAEAGLVQHPSENSKGRSEMLRLKNRMNSLAELLLNGRSLAERGSDAARTARRREVGNKDELAWSSLYGIKGSEPGRRESRAFVAEDAEATRAFGEKAAERERLSAPEDGSGGGSGGNGGSGGSGFLKLKKELLLLQKKMADEKSVRLLLESRIAEMNLDLTEKQNLEQELVQLKRKMNRDCVRKFETEVLRYQQELESKREKYLGGPQLQIPGDEYKIKCQTLAEERQRSEEIRNRLCRSESLELKPPTLPPPPPSPPPPPPPPHLPTSCPEFPLPTALSSAALDPQIKNHLDQELRTRIQKYSNDALEGSSRTKLRES